jgi:hypothetical protein
MSTRSRRTLLLAPLAFLAWALPLAAGAQMRIEGQTFEAMARVANADVVLNGVGVRAVAWFKAYAAALYLGARANTSAQVVSMPGAKRLQLRILRDLPAAEFVKALRVGMPRNSDPALMPQLVERLERLAAIITALDTVHEGDVINLDFTPMRGLLFELNGKLRGDAIPGADFYGALLLVFIGEHPSDRKLRAGLLGVAA